MMIRLLGKEIVAAFLKTAVGYFFLRSGNLKEFELNRLISIIEIHLYLYKTYLSKEESRSIAKEQTYLECHSVLIYQIVTVMAASLEPTKEIY